MQCDTLLHMIKLKEKNVRTYICSSLTKLPSSGGSVPDKLFEAIDLHGLYPEKLYVKEIIKIHMVYFFFLGVSFKTDFFDYLIKCNF